MTRGQAAKWKRFEGCGGGDVKSVHHDESGKGRVERRIYAVNCSVRMKIYFKGENKLCKI